MLSAFEPAQQSLTEEVLIPSTPLMSENAMNLQETKWKMNRGSQFFLKIYYKLEHFFALLHFFVLLFFPLPRQKIPLETITYYHQVNAKVGELNSCVLSFITIKYLRLTFYHHGSTSSSLLKYPLANNYRYPNYLNFLSKVKLGNFIQLNDNFSN